MIPANELRIGNWVDVENASTIIDNSSGAYQKIVRAKYEQVESISNEFALAGGFHCLEYGEPIPLTPEIVIACGFEKRQHKWNDGSVSENDYWLGKYHVGFTEKDGIYFARVTHDGNPCWLCSLQHLHQLQNTYFCLTGTELTIDESKLKQ